VVTYRAESWTLNEVVDKQLATFERKVLSRVLGVTKGNKN
jgi:hypothetical protein